MALLDKFLLKNGSAMTIICGLIDFVFNDQSVDDLNVMLFQVCQLRYFLYIFQ